MIKKLAALSVMLLAVCSTAAFAFVDPDMDELTAEEVDKGVRVFFIGTATPRNVDSTSNVECPPLRVSLRAYVIRDRAKGTMVVDGTSYDMYARRDKNGVWHGVLSIDGKKVGRFRGRYLSQRKVFIGGMKLNGRVYKLHLRRVFLARAEPIPLKAE